MSNYYAQIRNVGGYCKATKSGDGASSLPPLFVVHFHDKKTNEVFHRSETYPSFERAQARASEGAYPRKEAT